MKRTGSKDYEVVFIGDSLAARLAAALLAKKGCRVLTVHDNRELTSPWLTSSLIFERLLDLLDGRSCNATPKPFQVLSPNLRVEFNGKNPLKEELRRELAAEQAEVITFFDDLMSLGNQIEDLLYENQGLPKTGFTKRLAFRKKCFKADIPQRVFRQTLQDRLDKFCDPAAKRLLSTLFSGFSFTPAHRLTLAECALIWSGLGRQSGLSRAGLGELLSHRYRQFHGEEMEMHRLARLKVGKNDKAALLFDDKSMVTAEHLVFAGREQIHLCENLAAPPARTCINDHISANLEIRVSPLLAPNIIVDDTPPLRLSLRSSDQSTQLRVENAAIGETGLISAETIEKRLRRIIPFVDLNLQQQSSFSNTDLSISSHEKSPLLTGFETIQIGSGHKYLCDGTATLPELGTVGDALVALTVCNQLLLATGKQPV